uniref:NADH-ubiquinone oxidoreductase chain 4L n=1 Tax=Thalassina squamifera TaxID=576635 RepID=A0A411ATV3_9EUCA|nr:NADH dehydrogenase subunit 4L [Thalassina squamifera]QAX91434.1 NADH dehydrogenase subunit 4L [Thalassina squamifera]
MTSFSVVFFNGGLLMVVSGVWALVSYRKHFLNALLSLEFIMLGLFWLLSCVFSSVGVESYFLFFFLTLAACEGALGLSLLVSVVRTHGNDYFNSFSIL